ncbi:MAG TPA: hypothetical protein VIY71_01130 [Solirubrobacterales bacterium]
MRALAISDTHFGAWTGRDLLREEFFLERLAPGPGYFRSFLARRLPGVEIEIAYPTYAFAGVLCIHGHYLDPHARLAGSRGDRLLTRVLWGIATGGPEQPKTIEDYESTITLLTEWLYIAAQMPHGTHAQQNVFRAVQRAGRVASAAALPLRGAKRLAAELRDRGVGADEVDGGLPSAEHFDSVSATRPSASAASSPRPERPGLARPTRRPR